MTSTNDLFNDQGPAYAAQPDRLEMVAGKVVARMNKPSAAQKRFNTLMERIDAEQAMVQRLRQALDTQGATHRASMEAMDRRQHHLFKRMVVFLDGRIQAAAKPRGLTDKQKQQATHVLLMLCDQLQAAQDPEITALHRRYAAPHEEGDGEGNGEGDFDPQAQTMEEVRALARELLGEAFLQGRNFASPEELLRAVMEHQDAQRQAQEDKRQAQRAQRKAAKAPSAREQAAAAKALDASNALRTVFRQLASALHPDREPDEAQRAHKTALMSEVNAAYERQDLSTLLRIQLQTELMDASRAAQVSDDRLKAMCDVLAAQLRTLESDGLRLRSVLQMEFGYYAHARFDEAKLRAHLAEVRSAAEGDLAEMESDLEHIQDDKQLKTWLKDQVRIHKSIERERAYVQALPDFMFEDIYGTAPARPGGARGRRR